MCYSDLFYLKALRSHRWASGVADISAVGALTPEELCAISL